MKIGYKLFFNRDGGHEMNQFYELMDKLDKINPQPDPITYASNIEANFGLELTDALKAYEIYQKHIKPNRKVNETTVIKD